MFKMYFVAVNAKWQDKPIRRTAYVLARRNNSAFDTMRKALSAKGYTEISRYTVNKV